MPEWEPPSHWVEVTAEDIRAMRVAAENLTAVGTLNAGMALAKLADRAESPQTVEQAAERKRQAVSRLHAAGADCVKVGLRGFWSAPIKSLDLILGGAWSWIKTVRL